MKTSCHVFFMERTGKGHPQSPSPRLGPLQTRPLTAIRRSSALLHRCRAALLPQGHPDGRDGARSLPRRHPVTRSSLGLPAAVARSRWGE